MISRLVLAAWSAMALPRVEIVGQQFVNTETNNTVVFHGVNVVVKVPPYIPSQGQFDPIMSLTRAEMSMMRDWGINLVRLGVIWEAVEKAPGVYDHEYLAQVEELVNLLGEFGIYTIVDAH
jgi:endoglycosylceramidase